jgi:hypothetical protein
MSRTKQALSLKKRRLFWQDQVRIWGKSGLSQAQYCRLNNLNSHQLSYWKNKLKITAQEKMSLVEVTISDNSFSNNSVELSCLRLIVGDKFKIDIHPNFDQETLKQLINTLGQL